MGIKHMPSGLFPHFDSGLERIPYLVRTGDTVDIGCRLDDSVAEAVTLLVQDGEMQYSVSGVHHSTNDRGQRYFRFSFSPQGGTVCYQFATSDEEKSKKYTFPVLHEKVLHPEKIDKDPSGYKIEYESDTQKFFAYMQVSNGIRFCFTRNLTVKVDKNNEILEQINCIQADAGGLTVQKGGELLARICPDVRLLLDSQGNAHEITLTMDVRGNAFYGFGEKFDSINQAGKKPLNYVVEQYSHQQDKTYCPVPFFFSDAGFGFLQTNSDRSSFDLTAPRDGVLRRITVTARCPGDGVLYAANLYTGSPNEILAGYARDTGKAALPPQWAFGPWMSSNGWNTQKEALEQIDAMNQTGIPATVMVLEAWSDEETFYIWNDAQYTPDENGKPFSYKDFTFPADGKWPDPMAFTQRLENENVKLILWQIPVVKYEAAPHGEQLDLDEAYATKNGLCIKNADGTPYRITEMWFGNSLMPDFTNPETLRWWFEKRRYLVEELHVAGFKTDGGEFLFDLDAICSDGSKIAQMHNQYPLLYPGAYHQFMDETMGKGKGITFSRAGYTGTQKYPILWAGDQVSDFTELRGQLTAGLSAGLSGIPFWGFDIGGFAGEFPSTELYIRSAAMAAFAPVMQFHSEPRSGQYYMTERDHWNNDRSPWNMAEANRDDRIIPLYRMYANLRMNLMPYIWQEAKHSSEMARPLMAHLIYDYSKTDLDAVRSIEDAYMFGRDLLVAPIIQEGAAEREVYLPKGKWFDFWDGTAYSGGRTITVTCALDRIPVFVRDGAVIPVNMNQENRMGTQSIAGRMPNRVGNYENLSFLCYGDCCTASFTDEAGNSLEIDRCGETVTICGSAAQEVSVYAMTGAPLQRVPGMAGRPCTAEIFERTVCGISVNAEG